MVATFDFGQGTDKTFHLLRAVTDGKIGQDVADITKFDLDIIFIAQDIIDFDPCKANIQRVDAEFCCIKIKHGVAVAELFAKGVIAAHGVDFLPRILGHICHLVEHLAAAQGQVAAEISRLDISR